MSINIKFSRKEKKKLKKITLALFTNFKRFKVKKDHIILKKRIWSINYVKIHVAELVFMELPRKLNEFCDKSDHEYVLPNFPSTSEAHEFFEDISNPIDYIYQEYKSVILSNSVVNEFKEEPLTMRERQTKKIKESKIIKKVIADFVDDYIQNATKVIESFESKLKVAYISTNSAQRAPPIFMQPVYYDTG